MRLPSTLLFIVVLASQALAQNPAPIVVPKGQFADLTVTVPKDSSLVWDISPTPIQEATNLPDGRIIFVGEPGATYTAIAFLIDFNAKKFTKTKYVFVFSGTPTKPPPDPKDPPPTTGLFFAVIRPDAPTDPSFTRVMGLPEWNTLKAAGHNYKAYTVKEAKAVFNYSVPDGTTLPCVVTLKNNPDGKGSTVVRKPIDLPGTGAGILKLPEGIP